MRVMYSFNLVLITSVFGFMLCEPPTSQISNRLHETLQELAEDAKQLLNDTAGRMSENVVALGSIIKDGMEDMLDHEFDKDYANEDNTTEFAGIEANGCDRGMLKKLETKCDTVYDEINEEAQMIEDENKKIEAVCCALEDFERCSLRAYDDANCAKDKAAIRENLKAARLFLSVVANITCTAFRGALLCKPNTSHMPKNFPNQRKEIAEDTKNVLLDNGSELLFKGIVEMDIKDTPEEMLTETDYDYGNQESVTESLHVIEKIEVNGCNRGLLKYMETKCENLYSQFYDKAQLIEDGNEKTKNICCALEDLERCTLQDYDDVNCTEEKVEIGEKYKAARLFLNFVDNVNCAPFRGSDLCKPPSLHMPKSLPEILQEIAEGTKKILDSPEFLFKGVIEMGLKVKYAMKEMLEENFERDYDNQENATESILIVDKVDVNGCNRGLLKDMETKCDNVYYQVSNEAQQIEDENAKMEAVCCALEDFERCNLRAYDDANCEDKTTVREYLKATRLFLSDISNITCSAFKGHCLFYDSSVYSRSNPHQLYAISYFTIIMTTFISLASFLP